MHSCRDIFGGCISVDVFKESHDPEGSELLQSDQLLRYRLSSHCLLSTKRQRQELELGLNNTLNKRRKEKVHFGREIFNEYHPKDARPWVMRYESRTEISFRQFDITA
jgi:hypothetical protein